MTLSVMYICIGMTGSLWLKSINSHHHQMCKALEYSTACGCKMPLLVCTGISGSMVVKGIEGRLYKDFRL